MEKKNEWHRLAETIVNNYYIQHVDSINAGNSVPVATNPDIREAQVVFAAHDRSSPGHVAKVYMRPWGEEQYKITCYLNDEAIGRNVYQNFWNFSKKSLAVKSFDTIMKKLGELRDETNLKGYHSVVLKPMVYASLHDVESDVPDFVDENLKWRFRQDSNIDSDMGNLLKERRVPFVDNRHWAPGQAHDAGRPEEPREVPTTYVTPTPAGSPNNHAVGVYSSNNAKMIKTANKKLTMSELNNKRYR